MQIITVMAAVMVGALSSITYVRYAASRSPGRPIPLFSTRLALFPLWADVTFTTGWIVSSFTLVLMLPIWVGVAACCGATVLPFEVTRRRHNRQVRGRALTP
ncbi:hypothetical protein ACIQWL_20345 [Streptomyces mirabilis]|uniref:hypothetical protein n=1 Tax=Streptomyces mirabilis TaxID=68239 RepID=UPI0033EE3DC7